jgi:hypothetical protein
MKSCTGIIAILSIGVVIVLTSNSILGVFGGSGLKVFVNLYHSGSGSAQLCVSSSNENLGCDIISLSQYPNPTRQGPWEFGPGMVAEGDSFSVCAINVATGQEKCRDGFNSPAKKPESISIAVPGQGGTSGSPATKGGINWGEVCRTFDLLITEPCGTLTTPDGFTLTSEGNRVFLVCIGGGALATVLGYPEAVAPLGQLARCGQSTTESDVATNLLKDFLGK